jgi:hypothetical protein
VFRCPSRRHETVPCGDSRAREDEGALGHACAHVYDCVGSNNVSSSPSNELRVVGPDGVLGAFDEQASSVVAQDKFAKKYVRLKLNGNASVSIPLPHGQPPGERTHGFRFVTGDEVTRTVHEYVCPIALLMYDTCETAVVRGPFSRWLASKPLDAAKGGVLNDN